MRLSKEQRERQIIMTTARLGAAYGLYSDKVTRITVAKRCGISRPAVSKYFPSDDMLRRAVIQEAVDRKFMKSDDMANAIIAHAASLFSPVLDNVDSKIIERALEWLREQH